MPVEFESYDPIQGRLDLAEGTNAGTILSFLAARPELGFPPKEIHEATGVARGSVGPTLRRLAEHKGEYWAAAEDRVAALAGVTLSMESLDERFGDDWYGRDEEWADGLPDLGERAGENDAG